jgi:hypothetical protein
LLVYVRFEEYFALGVVVQDEGYRNSFRRYERGT